jgi:hypothetical protein
VQHRLLSELEPDEIFGASVVLVCLDATKETDALGRVHERVAIGEFTEVERASDGGADRGAPARQNGERAFTSAKKFALGE